MPIGCVLYDCNIPNKRLHVDISAKERAERGAQTQSYDAITGLLLLRMRSLHTTQVRHSMQHCIPPSYVCNYNSDVEFALHQERLNLRIKHRIRSSLQLLFFQQLLQIAYKRNI